MWRRVTSAGLAVAMAGLGVVGMPPQPAQAFFPGVTVFVQATLTISATFNFGGGNGQILRAIEQAKQQILAEIDASEARIVEHIDQTEAAGVAGCIRTATTNLRRIDQFETRAELRDRATHVQGCADNAGALLETVATLSVVDYLGYAIAEANAIAAVFNASAGLDLETQLTHYIADFELLIPRLEPDCRVETEPTDHVSSFFYRHDICTAYNGDSATHTAVCHSLPNPPWVQCSARADLAALRDQASVNTSRVVAREALPGLRRALAMVQRDFVVVVSDPSAVFLDREEIQYWHEDGPLFWTDLSNPGAATSLTTAIDSGDRRFYFAVMGGHLWTEIRNRNDSWRGWLPWNIPASAVTAAANAQGQVHVTAVLNGVIHHRLRTGEGIWTDFLPVPGVPAGTVTELASTVDPSGRLHLVSVIDGRVGHQLRNTAGPWTNRGDWGVAATGISAAAQADGQVHVAAVSNGQVFHRMRIGEGVWTDFAPVGGLPAGSTVTEVASAIDPAGNYQLPVVIVRDGLHEVHQRTRFPNGGWSPEWMRLGVEEDTFLSIAAIAAS